MAPALYAALGNVKQIMSRPALHPPRAPTVPGGEQNSFSVEPALLTPSRSPPSHASLCAAPQARSCLGACDSCPFIPTGCVAGSSHGSGLCSNVTSPDAPQLSKIAPPTPLPIPCYSFHSTSHYPHSLYLLCVWLFYLCHYSVRSTKQGPDLAFAHHCIPSAGLIGAIITLNKGPVIPTLQDGYEEKCENILLVHLVSSICDSIHSFIHSLKRWGVIRSEGWGSQMLLLTRPAEEVAGLSWEKDAHCSEASWSDRQTEGNHRPLEC